NPSNIFVVRAIYIFFTVFSTVFIAVFFVLYPMSFPDTTLHFDSLFVFLYACLSLLPFMCVLSLVLLLLQFIKKNKPTTLEFLTYVLLSLIVWLIIIPVCIFFMPEQYTTIAGDEEWAVLVAEFFKANTMPAFDYAQEGNSFSPSTVIPQIFSHCIFLRETARTAGDNGRLAYLVFASLGLSIASLYALCSVSSWKLINVSTILFLGLIAVVLNLSIYKQVFTVGLDTNIQILIANGVFFSMMILIGMSSKLSRLKHSKEGI
ncbi:MAG: hypothetical protein R3Y36_06230, partial [Spirochaetales bacterium]